jgi:hypothetical protein
VGNRGVLEVSLSEPYSVTIEKFGRFLCEESPCHLRVPFGKKTVCIEKEGFYPICEEKKIAWQKTLLWAPTLTREPFLLNAEEIYIEDDSQKPKTVPPPPPLNDSQILIVENYHYNKKTGELFQKTIFGEQKLITRFYQLPELNIMPIGKNVLAFTEKEIFFVDTKKRKKKRLLKGKNIQIQLLDDESVLVFENEKITRLFPKSEVMIELPFVAEQEHIIKCNANTLRYSTTAAGITTFFEYDIRKEITRILTSAKINQDFSLQCGKNANEIRIDFSESSDQIIRLQ